MPCCGGRLWQAALQTLHCLPERAAHPMRAPPAGCWRCRRCGGGCMGWWRPRCSAPSCPICCWCWVSGALACCRPAGAAAALAGTRAAAWAASCLAQTFGLVSTPRTRSRPAPRPAGCAFFCGGLKYKEQRFSAMANKVGRDRAAQRAQHTSRQGRQRGGGLAAWHSWHQRGARPPRLTPPPPPSPAGLLLPALPGLHRHHHPLHRPHHLRAPRGDA